MNKLSVSFIKIIKKLPYFVNTFCFVTCLIHVYTIMYDDLNPKHPRSRVYKKQMHEIKFPVEFLLCVNYENEMERYNSVGYPDNGNFFRGFLNETSTGWGGLNANGTSYGTVKGWIRVY